MCTLQSTFIAPFRVQNTSVQNGIFYFIGQSCCLEIGCPRLICLYFGSLMLDINGQFCCLKIGGPRLISLYFGFLMLYVNGFKLQTFLKMSSLKWDKSQPPQPQLQKLLHKSQHYQVSRYPIVHYFKFFKYNTLYCFAYILTLWYWTEMFLYSRQNYGFHLFNKICSSLLACLFSEKL